MGVLLLFRPSASSFATHQLIPLNCIAITQKRRLLHPHCSCGILVGDAVVLSYSIPSSVIALSTTYRHTLVRTNRPPIENVEPRQLLIKKHQRYYLRIELEWPANIAAIAIVTISITFAISAITGGC